MNGKVGAHQFSFAENHSFVRNFSHEIKSDGFIQR